MKYSTPAAILKLEVARFAAVNKLNQGEEAHQLALLDGFCQAFRSKLMAYYHAGATADERLMRLGEISQLFRETRFTDMELLHWGQGFDQGVRRANYMGVLSNAELNLAARFPPSMGLGN